MDTMNVANYGAAYGSGSVNTSRYLADSRTKSLYDQETDSNGAKKSLGMQDFLQLMVAQMRNQDIMNPTDNSEFVAQMAQFSTLEAMTTMAEQVEALKATVDDMSVVTNTQYGASLIGKKVYVSYYDENNNQVNVKGTVASVLPTSEGGLITLAEAPKSAYPLYNVMEVVSEFRKDDNVDFPKVDDDESEGSGGSGDESDGSGGGSGDGTPATQSVQGAGGRVPGKIPSDLNVIK